MADIDRMSSYRNMDEIIAAVKQCFPEAQKFRILENPTNEPQRNYMSVIIRLTVEYELEELPTRKFLIVKVPKRTGFASACSESNIFSTEIFMYDTILPRINASLDEPLSPVRFKPTTDSKILILENLTTYGYEDGDDSQLYGFTQCLPILKALAHFHATTRRASQLEPDLLHNKLFKYPSFFDFKLRSVAFWEPILGQLLARSDSSLIPKLRNAILYLGQNYDSVKTTLHYSNFEFCVLNHGDLRKANVLLKIDPQGQIEGVKIIDFQNCFWSSPVFDFFYFFLLCTQADVIDNHYEALLDWYLRCLNEKLGHVDAGTYRQRDFLDDLRRLRICTIFHVTMAAILLCPLDAEELLQTIARGKIENADTQRYTEACLGDQRFTDTVSSILKFFDKTGLYEP